MSSSVSASTTTSETSSYQDLRISGLASGWIPNPSLKAHGGEETKVFKIEQEKPWPSGGRRLTARSSASSGISWTASSA
jgi:hypothetical protein